jgi:hypothetical protein
MPAVDSHPSNAGGVEPHDQKQWDKGEDLMGRRKPEGFEGFVDRGVLKPEQLHELLARGLKRVLPPQFWDHSKRVILRPNISNENIERMNGAFCEATTESMNAKTVANACIDWVIPFDRALQNPRCKLRIRKKRATRLKKWTRRQLLLQGDGHLDGQGLTLFVRSVKIQFLIRPLGE